MVSLSGLASSVHYSICPSLHPSANYRRLLGDRHWPFDTPFRCATDYFPAPLLALRTLKAELAVGIAPEAQARAAATHPGTSWLTAGVFGVAQLSSGTTAGRVPELGLLGP